MTTTQTKKIAASYPAEVTAGYEAFNAGQMRLVPRDILVDLGADAARAWYLGWDAGNLEG